MKEAKRSYGRIEVDIDLMDAFIETEAHQGVLKLSSINIVSCFSKLENLTSYRPNPRPTALRDPHPHLNQLEEEHRYRQQRRETNRG